MKKAIQLLVLFLLPALFCACNRGEKIAVVDENRILLQSRLGRKATEQGDMLHGVMQENLAAVERVLATYPNKNQAANILMTEMNIMQISLAEEQERIFHMVDATLAQAIEDYRSKNNISIVVSAAHTLAFSATVDISDVVIPIFDAKPLTFAPLPAQVHNPQLPPPVPAE